MAFQEGSLVPEDLRGVSRVSQVVPESNMGSQGRSMESQELPGGVSKEIQGVFRGAKRFRGRLKACQESFKGLF